MESWKVELKDDAGKWLTGVIETSQICKELFIEVDDERLKLVNLDPAHTQYYELELKNFDCNYFDGPSDGYSKKMVDTEELIKVLKRWRSGYNIILEDDPDKFNLKIIFTNDRGVEKKFNIKYVDANYDMPRPPELNFKSGVVVDLKDIKEVIGDLETMNDKFNIVVDEDRELILSAAGEWGDLKVKVPNKNFDILQGCRSVISLDKFKDTIKSLKSKTDLELEIGDDHPLGTRAPWGLSSYMRVLTAPRIESEV